MDNTHNFKLMCSLFTRRMWISHFKEIGEKQPTLIDIERGVGPVGDANFCVHSSLKH